ncbi:hypothetical protein J2S09_000487 [Bacillus fengqiuensis]|nr:hypothetical protein [Bacillus fengqiuensis]
MKNLTAIHFLNIETLVREDEVYNIHVDYDGNLILLVKKKVGNREQNTIFHILSSGVREINFPVVSESFDLAQPLGENWLLVRSRTENKNEKNAFIFDIHGNLVNAFPIGDAIQDIQTTKESDIWVSYFDEGIGDSSGLNCFNNQGIQTFDFYDFVKETGSVVPYIDDCYALNVTSDYTYIYYYSAFPIVKLNKNDFEIFHNIPVEGSHAFSIKNDFVLFSHDYDHKGEVQLYSLRNNNVERFYTLNQEGKPLNYHYAVSRESKLFLMNDKDIYLLNLEDILQ